ncbi:Bug family tripartite tricarboxylate transporter substrate binding protein [Myceligenerans pegani]|uniref:Tripartite tricarboxylate transporter substrate binding protein n=1 Tax=Myceligenerans pegani TaxID=2776917 RepID=A0ABR9MWS0_9MICO|nr:tripartite tricarboxylate transporter substrate-binding protein [Myceligenerans sp. TRM 65318]MBE1875823.1 tripartite tricarboxylate transporter substrate binding protein [Myceligenerans sp. TRM 65318]MBE3018094.1 tripartite tricarboxylate transporter substrate binding protein [Myceligenerans sp. TRM 65318]
MRISRTVVAPAGIALALALAGCGSLEANTAGGDDATIDELSIVVPAAPGGGWDQTGRALQADLQAEGLVGRATVTNVDGAGGTVGLANIANATDPNTLLVMGLVMVGAVETNESQARIEDTTPIARLTEEQEVIVVPKESPYETVEDLVRDIEENGKDVTVTGGSAGGADHILAGMLLEAAGMTEDEITADLNYVAYSGGGESLAALLGNKVDAGISGVAEYAEQVEAGELKALAVSGEERVAALPDTPTLTESGYDVVLTNWRGVVAPGDIDEADREALIAAVTGVVESDSWAGTLEEYGWADAFLPGDEFDTYLTENIAEVRTTLQDIGLVR